MDITAIILGAGKGLRSNQKNKMLFTLPNGKSVIENCIATFLNQPKITQIIVTCSSEDYQTFCDIAKKLSDIIQVVVGGQTRTLSVLNALKFAKGDVTLIHDGARTFVTNQVIENCIDTTIKHGSGITCFDCTDTIAITDDNGKIVNCSRDNMRYVQTPQGFYTKDIVYAYSQIKQGDVFTDDSGVYNEYVKPATICQGDANNIKLTYPNDFNANLDVRVGTGFDLHQLVEGRKLILGGVEIKHDKGLLGHSDADALVHAVMDALLSSVALRDIGYYFSDKDQQYKDIDSFVLLKKVYEMVLEKGYKPKNISAVIMAQQPKLMAYVPKMVENIAKALDLSSNDIGITCTTMESIGLVGREQGIAVNAYCSVCKR